MAITRDGKLWIKAKHRKALRRAQIELRAGRPFSHPFLFLDVPRNLRGYRWDRTHRCLIPVISGIGSRRYAGTSTPPDPGDDTYAIIDTPPATFFMEPTRLTNGSGSEIDPFQPSQVLGASPSSAITSIAGSIECVIEMLPGDISYTEDRATGSGRKLGYWRPRFNGSETHPVIIRTTEPATRNGSNKTRILQVGGTGGAQLGLGEFGLASRSWVYISGLELPTWNQSNGGETAQIGIWGTDHCKIVRCITDAEGQGVGNETNGGSCFAQVNRFLEVGDCIFRNYGEGTDESVFSGFEAYALQDSEIHHITVLDNHGQGIFQKGLDSVLLASMPNVRNRYHHLFVKGTGGSGLFDYISGPNSNVADANLWYQFICKDTDRGGIELNFGYDEDGVADHSGSIFQNGVIDGCSSGVAPVMHGPDETWTYQSPTRFYNLIITNSSPNAAVNMNDGFFDSGSYQNSFLFDYNQYHGNAQIFADADGNRAFGGVGGWQSLIGEGGQTCDQHGATGDPSYTNSAADDYTLQGGSSARNAGYDALGLSGTVGATVHRGAYPVEMTDTVGCRSTV